jgi:hypothetical protein
MSKPNDRNDQEEIDAQPRELKEQERVESGPLLEDNTPSPECPHKTLREVMADCVSALSLGPEDLDSVRATFARKKTAQKDAERRDGNRGEPE